MWQFEVLWTFYRKRNSTCMELNCFKCGQLIQSLDWENNNVKQLSVGLAHDECPNKILISNCPESMNKDLLYKLFSPYGAIMDHSITDGYGLIEYDNRESIQSAIDAMNNFEMGQHKLSVQMYIKDNKQISIIKPEEPAANLQPIQLYIYTKQQLTNFNAREISSLLVPKSKIYKKIYKQWMQLTIKHKQEVIEFIYHSKINEPNNAFTFNFIQIPDYLKKMLIFKKDIDAARYVKNQPRPKKLPSHHIIIVWGYIRNIEKKINYRRKSFIIPSTIIEICFNYYISMFIAMKIFCIEENEKLIEFQLSKGKILTQTMIVPAKYRTNIKNINNCVCIPDLMSTDLPHLQHFLDPNISYYGIFGNDMSDQSVNTFILREKINEVDHYYMSFKSPNNLQNFKNKYAKYIFCEQYGIIASDWKGLYQLKLKDINGTENYKFTKIYS
eukprot:429835_1